MENKNIFLGKIEKNGCYLNDGKYGYFLRCEKQNFKSPEYLLPEEVSIDMSKRIIEYKKKMSKQYFVPKEAAPSCGSDDDDGCDGKVPKLKIKV
jgi:hypothetical protein